MRTRRLVHRCCDCGETDRAKFWRCKDGLQSRCKRCHQRRNQRSYNSPLTERFTADRAHGQMTLKQIGAALGVTRARAGQLVNRYPLVRYYARQALEKIAGRPCDVNLDQDDSDIRAEAARWLEDAK